MIVSVPGHCLSLTFFNLQYFSLALYTISFRVTDKASA